MKKLTNADHVERVFMHAELSELPALLDRAQLIVRMRQVQNGTAPAKKTRKPKADPTQANIGVKVGAE